MKKIFLILALALTVSVAEAWEKRPDHGVFLLAKMHMSAEAKGMVDKYFGEESEDDMRYLNNLEQNKKAKHSREIHYLHLGSDLMPMQGVGDDALVAIKHSLEIVRARDSHSDTEVRNALRTIVNLMCDIHNFAYVRIDGVPHSQQDFKFECFSGDTGKRKVSSMMKWSKLWDYYTHWHGGFSGALWAEDMELCLGAKRAEFSQGSLNEWAEQIGEVASELYARINPTYVMSRRERNELEELNYEMMTRAGYRLAALLNEILK